MENFLMSPIHKKGSEVDCENYKGIAVTRTVSRMYGGLLRNKIKREYKDYEAEEQAGFRIERSRYTIYIVLPKSSRRKPQLIKKCTYCTLIYRKLLITSPQ